MSNNLHETLNCHSIDHFLTRPASSNKSLTKPTNSNIPRHHNSAIVPQINFKFDTANQHLSTTCSTQRIHAKKGTKRIGGKVLIGLKRQKIKQQNKQKENHNITINSYIQQRQDTKISEQNQSTQFISIKSYQRDSNFNSIAEQDDLDEISHLPSNHASRNSSSNIKENDVYDIFKQVKRKFAGQLQYSKNTLKKKNCFFTNLKKKLTKQVKKAEQQATIDRLSLLIEGCHTHTQSKDSSRVHINKKQIGKSCTTSRPHTTSTKPNMTPNLSHQLRERKSSVEPSNSQRSLDSERFFRKITKRGYELLQTSVKKQRNTTQQKNKSKLKYFQNRINTLQPEEARSSINPSSVCTYANSQLSYIINQCSRQKGTKQLKSNMKLFQYYTKKMDEGFERASKKIQEAQQFQVD